MSSFFQKLGFGLKKTSNKISTGISDIFTKKKVDSQTLDELEELLITSDIGVKAASKIINAFGKRRLDKDISDEEIKQELAADMEQILAPCQQALKIDANQKPFVILMVGVNGAGKTTTIGKLAAKFLKEGKKVSAILSAPRLLSNCKSGANATRFAFLPANRAAMPPDCALTV